MVIALLLTTWAWASDPYEGLWRLDVIAAPGEDELVLVEEFKKALPQCTFSQMVLELTAKEAFLLGELVCAWNSPPANAQSEISRCIVSTQLSLSRNGAVISDTVAAAPQFEVQRIRRDEESTQGVTDVQTRSKTDTCSVNIQPGGFDGTLARKGESLILTTAEAEYRFERTQMASVPLEPPAE